MADIGAQLNSLSPEQRQAVMMQAQQEANQSIMQELMKEMVTTCFEKCSGTSVRWDCAFGMVGMRMYDCFRCGCCKSPHTFVSFRFRRTFLFYGHINLCVSIGHYIYIYASSMNHNIDLFYSILIITNHVIYINDHPTIFLVMNKT